MAKIKLVTCESGFNLHAFGNGFMAWEDGVEEYLEGDVVFEVEEDCASETENGHYTIASGSEILVLEVIADEE